MTYPSLRTNDGWEIFPLFAKAVSLHHVPDEMCLDLQEMALQCEWREDDGSDGTNGAVSAQKNVLDLNEKVKEQLYNIVLDYVIKTMGYLCDVQFTTSWFTRTYEGGFCEEHMHSNSWLSGIIYYGEYDEGSSAIQFADSNPSNICVQTMEFNFFNSYCWNFTPEKAMILLFPSDLRHKVLRHKSEWTRNALAFNVMPKGDAGMQDSTFQY